MAKIIDGRLISKQLLLKVALEVEKMRQRKIEVCLAVIIIGFDYASRIYINNKKKVCENLKIKFDEYQLNEDISFLELAQLVDRLNKDKNVNGILIQLPLPAHLESFEVANLINPVKDVDGFCYNNLGKMFKGKEGLLPCTPAGIMCMLDYEKIDVSSKHCVVVGKSNIVGKPLSILLLEKGATVTVCCSKTVNLESFTKTADILISAVGSANLIKEDMVKKDSIIIDVGINRDLDGKLCGDVDFIGVEKKVRAITPVPGGVGPLTVAKLIDNVVYAAKIQNDLDL